MHHRERVRAKEHQSYCLYQSMPRFFWPCASFNRPPSPHSVNLCPHGIPRDSHQLGCPGTVSYSRPHRCLFVETLHLWTARFQKTSSSLQDCTDCFRNDRSGTCLCSSLACLALLKRDSHGACENRDIKLEGIFKSVQQMPFISSTRWLQPV